jgi:hypothetical protein
MSQQSGSGAAGKENRATLVTGAKAMQSSFVVGLWHRVWTVFKPVVDKCQSEMTGCHSKTSISSVLHDDYRKATECTLTYIREFLVVSLDGRVHAEVLTVQCNQQHTQRSDIQDLEKECCVSAKPRNRPARWKELKVAVEVFVSKPPPIASSWVGRPVTLEITGVIYVDWCADTHPKAMVRPS